MTRIVAVAGVAVIAGLVACGPTDQTQIVPGQSVDRIVGTTRQADLRRWYGDDQVTSRFIDVGEGFVCAGARVAFSDGEYLDITWRDVESRSDVASIRINGQRWATDDGLRRGLTLKQVEEINRGPFVLTGFGWDYGGTVLSWNQGHLSSAAPQDSADRLFVRFSSTHRDWDGFSRQELDQIMGDRDLSSAHPVLQALNPPVGRLKFDFGGDPCPSFFRERSVN